MEVYKMKSLKKLDIDKVLGEVFKEYRVKNKLTQEKIAEKLQCIFLLKTVAFCAKCVQY